MKRTKLTAEELTQLNELLSNQIEGFDEKFQSYLQEVTAKPISKDIKISELSQAWEDTKQKCSDVKEDMKDCAESFHNMNRAARRQVMASYNNAVVSCNAFYQNTADACKQGIATVASIPKQIGDAAKESIDKAEGAIKGTINKANCKIDSFKKTIATKVKDAYTTVKLAVIDFGANRIASLANIMDKVYDNVETKINNCTEAITKTQAINGKELDAYNEINSQISEMGKLSTESLKHGQLGLAARYGEICAVLQAKKELSPTVIAGKRTNALLYSLDEQIAKLSLKEVKIQKLGEKLTEIAEALKAKLQAYTK